MNERVQRTVCPADKKPLRLALDPRFALLTEKAGIPEEKRTKLKEIRRVAEEIATVVNEEFGITTGETRPQRLVEVTGETAQYIDRFHEEREAQWRAPGN